MNLKEIFETLEDCKVYSVTELSELCGLTTATIRNYIRRGGIPKVRYNKQTHISGENFKRYLRGEKFNLNLVER